MGEITSLANIDLKIFLLSFFVICFAIKEIIELFLYYKKKFGIKTEAEENRKNLEEKIKNLEEIVLKQKGFPEKLRSLEINYDNQREEIRKISKGIEDIVRYMKEKEKYDNETFKAQLSAELYHLHAKFVNQGYVNRVDLELFQKLSDSYINRGGNSIFRNKIIPEVLNLQIKEEV